MSVTEKFKHDSAIAAIRALRGLEQTATMLETYAPEIFPEVNEQGQVHFGRVMMESAAQSIRQAWADAIKEVANSDRNDHVAEMERLKKIEALARAVANSRMASDDQFRLLEELDEALGISPDTPITPE